MSVLPVLLLLLLLLLLMCVACYVPQLSLTNTSSTSISTLNDTGSSSAAGSPASTQRSPVLTPVYTSDAAREIVDEMRRQEMMAARRAVPRHKRRHITVSCSQPLALEALASRPNPVRCPFTLYLFPLLPEFRASGLPGFRASGLLASLI